MFSRYYLSEMSYLRELGREFAVRNPALSGLFADKGGDPDVARLLEGFAFLAARIRERIDDAIPELIDSLSQVVSPQLSRVFPAGTIVELEPIEGSVRTLQHVPAGTEIAARAVEGTRCTFRTTVGTDLRPLAVECTRLDASIEAMPKLRVRLVVARGGASHVVGALRFFVAASLAQASTIVLWMARHLAYVAVAGADGTERRLHGARVVPIGLDRSLPLLPWPDESVDDLRLLVEYFTLPGKLAFIELRDHGLERGFDRGFDPTRDDPARPAGLDEPSFDAPPLELVFAFSRPPRLPERVEASVLRLHCVPAVNLFDVSADPVTIDPRHQEHRLRASGIDPLHAEVHSVRSVVGIRDQRGGRRTYTPFFSFEHASRPLDEQTYYSLRRTRSPIDGGFDTYLRVESSTEAALLSASGPSSASGGSHASVEPRGAYADEVLSMELACTNRHLPAELRVGDVCEPTPRSPTSCRFHNVTHVSRPSRPPLGTDLHWKLVSHLAAGRRSFADPAALRALLLLYNFQEGVDAQLGRANRLRVEAIRRVTARPSRRIVDRVPTRGVDIEIELEETAFASAGDVFFFGSALDDLFAGRTSINSFHRLAIVAHPSMERIEWSPRNGLDPLC